MSKITERPLGPYDHSYLPGMMMGEFLSPIPNVNGKPADKFVVPDEITRKPKALNEESFLSSSENESVEK